MLKDLLKFALDSHAKNHKQSYYDSLEVIIEEIDNNETDDAEIIANAYLEYYAEMKQVIEDVQFKLHKHMHNRLLEDGYDGIRFSDDLH